LKIVALFTMVRSLSIVLIHLTFLASQTYSLPSLNSQKTSSFTAQDIPYEQKFVKGEIPLKKLTLADKATYFEERIKKRHIQHGFVRELTLFTSGEPENGGILHHSDNDGLWTSLYVAAMSFKIGILKDEETKKLIKESFHALERLEKITGIPGFPARSIVEVGEPLKYHYDGEWHLDPSGKWEWKGDTSSDELDGHFFAYALYYDLAADKKERERVKRLVERMIDHIIEHNWYLVDIDNKPTRWGVWNPEQLNHNKPIHGLPDEDWREERGLNSLEILSHLKVAYHVSGKKMYQKKYLELIQKHGYAENVLNQNVIDLNDLNHSDVELAFCAYYPLLKYETDPKLLKIYKTSLEKTWKIVKPERNPWWNFTASLFLQKDDIIEESVQTLRELVWEQINWKMENGQGPDIKLDPSYTKSEKLQSLEVLPYDQICIQRWNSNPYQLDSGGDGKIEGDGVLFLLPYWMGRYHGFIR